MADSDTFGDPSLFEEFEKERQPPDKMLLDKFKNEISPLSKGFFPVKHARAADEQSMQVDEGTAAGAESGSNSGIDEDGVYSDGDEGEGSAENGEPTMADEISAKISQIRRECSNHDNGSYGGDNRSNLIKEIMELRRENLRLKEKVRVVDPTIRFCDGAGPALEVVFLHNDFSRMFRGEIENYVNQLLEQYSRERGHLPTVSLLASNVPLSTKADVLLSDEAIPHINASTALGCSQFYQEFIVDGMGWPLVDNTPALTDGLIIPRYQAAFKSTLPSESDEEDADACPQPKRDKMKKSACFNCGGNHRLNECKEPRDQQRIAQMSREFQEAKANMPAKQVRYHQDADVSEKYGHLKPGVLSDQLRDAIGLRKNQLAPFIYQMRQLGYPPGWLEEAKVSTSGLSMFGKHGNAVDNDGDDFEDGEVDSQSSGVQTTTATRTPVKKEVLTPRATSTPISARCRRILAPKKEDTYDTSKIIDFPGFNVRAPDGIVDECESLGMPPMQPQHEKSVLELQLTKNTSDQRKRLHSEDSTGSRRKKLKPNPSNASETDLSTSDMDISSQANTMPVDALATLGARASADEELSSIEELERQRQLLQAQLDQDSYPSPPPIPPTPPASDRPPLPPGTPPGTPPISSLNLKPLQTPNNPPPLGKSLSITPGTPVVFEIGAKQDSLPDADKWADGIIQHIPYENLPGATGTFEKLRKTLSSVRGKKEKEKKD